MMTPVDFMTHYEFNPYEFMLVWGCPREIQVGNFRITGNVEQFIKDYLV